MDPVASPVDLIEEWRREASIFSSTDRLGNLISRSLEVLKGLARKELSFSDLEYSLESLDMERTLALKHDKAKDTDQVRSLMYGVIESIGLSVHAMISNDRIMKSEASDSFKSAYSLVSRTEASVEDPLTSQMDTSLEEMNASSALSDVSTSHGTPSTSHQQAHAEKDKRRSGSAILEDKQGPAKRPRMDDHGVIEHHPQQYHFASASPHFPAGDQHRPSMAPSSSSFTHPIKDEEESLFGEGVIIKEENVSPVDFVERPVYEPSQYTQWCHLYANTGPSTSSGSHPTDYFSNCLGPTAHMYESMYQPGSCHAGLNKNEIHQPSPAKSTASDDLNSKPFACEECGKTFASLRWKQNHIRNVHSADKTKFECTICGMRFTDRSNQRRHIRRQHELRCTVCDEKFDNKRAFEEHIWVVHGMRQQA